MTLYIKKGFAGDIPTLYRIWKNPSKNDRINLSQRKIYEQLIIEEGLEKGTAWCCYLL
jgi:hypothetical protein